MDTKLVKVLWIIHSSFNRKLLDLICSQTFFTWPHFSQQAYSDPICYFAASICITAIPGKTLSLMILFRAGNCRSIAVCKLSWGSSAWCSGFPSTMPRIASLPRRPLNCAWVIPHQKALRKLMSERVMHVHCVGSTPNFECSFANSFPELKKEEGDGEEIWWLGEFWTLVSPVRC